MGIPSRYLRRLGAPADQAEQHRIARVLASARVFLASAGLLAIYLDPTEPSRYENLAYGLLIAYVVYSLAVWQLQPWLDRFHSSVGLMHAVDLMFPAVFTLFTAGPNSPFFLYFVFVLTAAAFRWGLVETVATAITIMLVMIAEAGLLSYGGAEFGLRLQGEYDVNRFVIRILYLLILGLLIGYLAEEQKQLRAENTLVTRLMGKARLQAGMRGTMQAILDELLRIFRCRRALVVIEQTNSGRVFLWHSERDADGSNHTGSSELAAEGRAAYLVDCPVHGFYSETRGPVRNWVVWAVDGDGRRTRAAAGWSPSCSPELHNARSLLSVAFTVGEEWTGRIFLFDAITGPEKRKELRFVQKLLHQVGPAIYTVYLLRRLRSRAGALERARVARELHDGAIQALIAVEMEVDVLRREAARTASAVSVPPRLERIQQMLREQVFNLRSLMQQMRPVDLSPEQLLDYLSDVVERFRRDTGISAQFVCGLDEVDLPPRVCRELVRIVQEGLVNVRKHSGAGKVLVRLAMADGKWRLSVEDDGRGLGFSGRMSLPELDARRSGPQIIKERVRALGGDLQVESQPGQGCRLEITLPQKAQIAYV